MTVPAKLRIKAFQNWMFCQNLVKETKQGIADEARYNQTANQSFNKSQWKIRN